MSLEQSARRLFQARANRSVGSDVATQYLKQLPGAIEKIAANVEGKREEAANKNANDKAKLDVDREKLATQREIANKNLEIARENKNRYDVEASKKKSDQKKKK